MSMEERRHIQLPERKVLAARLVQIEAALPLKDKFGRLLAGRAYSNLDKKPPDIFEKLRTQLDDGKIQLDKFLDPFLYQLQHFARGDLIDKPDLFSELKDALDVRADKMACARCSKIPEKVCNGK